jgi:hypothetical protein
MSFIHKSKLFLFCHEIGVFFFEKHNVLLSETLFMNIVFLLNFLINSKQLLILTINANVLSSKKKSFMNISFLQNSWLILIFKLFKCTGFFSLTDIPAAHEIDNETNYNQEDRHISASLKFQNIYPLPQCMLSVGVCLIIIHLLIYHKIY